MDYPRCKTCKHSSTDVGALKESYLLCDKLAQFMVPKCDDDMIVSGHDAEWYVGPDFGCIHHEAK